MSTSPRLVVDSSVAFKWFQPSGEASVVEADDLLARHGRNELRLGAPSILIYEVLNALRSWGMSKAALAGSAAVLIELDLDIVEPNTRLMEEAAGLAVSRGLTVYDASFAALAIQWDCDLVTADRRAFADLGDCGVRLL